MAVTTSHDDGFREIQLSGKQLVFLFMAVTVVLVVTFLTGVLVGRGVRAERSAQAGEAIITESPAVPPRAAAPTPIEDPTKAAPPAETGDGPGDEKVPEAAPRPPVPAPKPVDVKPAPAPAPAVAATKPAAAPPVTAKAPPAPAPSAQPAPAPVVDNAPVRNGYAVQVAAVRQRGEADPFVKRLSAKGYDVYVEAPKGSQKMFRVRIGSFKTRREAQALANKLQKEEKLKPWVTR